MEKGRSNLRLKIAIVISLIFIWLLVGMFKYINDPNVQRKIFTAFNKVSTLNIESATLKLDILKRTISISNLDLFSVRKNQRFRANLVSFKLKLTPILKGNIKISDLSIDGLKIDVGEKPEKLVKKKRPKISLTNLLLLRNLTIKNGVINNIAIEMPNISATLERIDVNFIPSLTGKIRLSLKMTSPLLTTKSGNKFEAEEITASGSTNLNNWIDIFPYVDDLSGKIGCKEFQWKEIDVKTLDAELHYSNKALTLHDLVAYVNGNKVEIEGKANSNNQKYSLNINIPEPIYLPSLGREGSFADTSGHIDGKIHIEGTGLDYKNTNGVADVSLNHKIGGREPLPAQLTAKINISNGTMSTQGAILKVGDNTASVDGSFNYVEPNLNLSFHGENIPVENVLNRFSNKHYHPTKGLAKVSGTFSGWKPNLRFTLTADASPASYYNILVDRAVMDLDLTYNNLNLNGKIYQGKETGQISLKMVLGAKLADGSRYKTFDLAASVYGHDLSSTMSAYGLKGIGNGAINLSGTPTAFSGSGSGRIENGNIKGVGFTSVESNIKFSPKQIVFDQIKLATDETNPTIFPNPLLMDIIESGVHLHGNPRPNFGIDARYSSGPGTWQINKIFYSSLANPEWESSIRGTISGSGGLNLNATGILDTSLLSNLRGLVREAYGPAELKNIHITGTAENPMISGSLTVRDNMIMLRNWGYNIDKIHGDLFFNGNTIQIPEITGRIEYGDFKLGGTVTHQRRDLSNVDLTFVGKSILYATKNRTFKVELDCDLKLKGNPTLSYLTGDLNIIDGRYTKNFSLFEKMKDTAALDEEDYTEEDLWRNMNLDLKVKTSGDLKIDNNIGEIWLNADVKLKGTDTHPRTTGNIETIGGEIHYANLGFEVTRGFVEFRDPYTVPYVELTAAKEVDRYNINLTIRGLANKLLVDLNSTPPLERKDILALLTFGVTGDDMQKVRFGYQLGTGLIAEQIASVLQSSVTKFTPLDRFRIETSPTGNTEATRLYMGKDISDRLRINFVTDINSAETQQTFLAEYLITDFLLLKGAGATNADYRFNLTFRFSER